VTWIKKKGTKEFAFPTHRSFWHTVQKIFFSSKTSKEDFEKPHMLRGY
jgi:hypothetical protein